jgi:hypothetical protein
VCFNLMCIQALKIIYEADRDCQVSKRMFNEMLYEEWIGYAKQHGNMLLKPGETWTPATVAKGVAKDRFDQMVMESNPQFNAMMLDVVRAVELHLIPKLLDNAIELEIFSVPWDQTYRQIIQVAHATAFEHSCRACCRTYTSSLSCYSFLFVHFHLILISW